MTRPSRLSAARATWLYAAVTVVMTWPLALSLSRDIPWDLGDSILNTYILQWGADRLLAFLGGDLGALTGFWNANFFYPEPLTLAYSEHLLPQVLQTLPVYAVTGNAILSYNVVFLSTFVLSGLGTFLFARELTGSSRAAFVAGLVFAFAPYRIGQYSHLQVLSSQWMPFALYGLARYFSTRRTRALAGAVTALLLNNLSCGYFLLYFPAFVVLYVGWEVSRRGLWTESRVWLELGAAAAALSAATLPFVLPYARLRALGFEPRPVAEVAGFSADTWAYVTAHHLNRLWGTVMQAFPHAEGELFPGLLPLLLAGVALISWVVTTVRPGLDTFQGGQREARTSPWVRAAIVVASVIAISHAALLLALLVRGHVSAKVAGIALRASSPSRTMLIMVVALGVVSVLSPRARTWARQAWHSPVALALAGMGLAWVLSLGPRPTSLGRPIADWGPYAWLMQTVPGFDGLRVPARFAMVGALFTACGAALGVLVLERWRAFRTPAFVALVVTLLAESVTAPIQLNATSPLDGVVTPQGRLQTGEATPAVYRAVAELPQKAVLAEFPFGVEDYDLRYMLASAVHRRPLLNGYSGGFPASYGLARAVFGRVLAEPDRGWALLRSSGVTHVIVHEGTFLEGEGVRVSAWLASRGATRIASFGSDRLFALPPGR